MGGVDPGSVEAVAVTGQWGSTVPVDADGTPVGEARLFLDTRGARHTQKFAAGPLFGYHPRALVWLQRTAGAPSPQGGDPIGHMLAIQRDEPEVAPGRGGSSNRSTTSRCASPAGRQRAANSMTLAWLTDTRDPSRLDYDGRLVAWTEHRAPAVASRWCASGSVIGPCSLRYAVLGLPEGTVTTAGMIDLLASTVGSGRCCRGRDIFAVSTTTWISAPVPKKKTDIHHHHRDGPWPDSPTYLLASNHGPQGLHSRGCATGLRWIFRRKLTTAAARSGRLEWRAVHPRGWPGCVRRWMTAAPGAAGTTFS
ncbi:MAG: hypothetical protein IPL93_14560, partial [Actinomycetales bacterium]|nr:hypothetical protein [Actinomycetales bacterium]